MSRVAITASDVERVDREPMMSFGAHLRMDGGVYFYISKETAAQWLPVLETIANEKSTSA